MSSRAKAKSSGPYPGHEAICDAAVAHIEAPSEHPVVAFIGPIGAGRSRLSEAVIARLVASGYQRIAQPAPGTDFAAEQIRTIVSLHQQLAKSLPIPQLLAFLSEQAGWLGETQVAAIRLALRQRHELFGPSDLALAWRQQLAGIVAGPAGDGQPELRLSQIADAISLLLLECATPLVLPIDLSYATAELRQLALLLAERVSPPLALLLIADSEGSAALENLQAGRRFEVPPLTIKQVARLAHQHGLPLADPAVFTRLYALSQGRPEIIELILDEVRLQELILDEDQPPTSSPADYQAMILADDTLSLDGVGKRILDRMDAPARALHAFSGMLLEHGRPKTDDAAHDPLLAAFVDAQLRSPERLDEHVGRAEIWLERYAAGQGLSPRLRGEIARMAYRQELRRQPGRIGAWSGWLAGYLEAHQSDSGGAGASNYRDPLLIARYWLEAGRPADARRQVQAILLEPSLALDSDCANIPELLERLDADAPLSDRANLAMLSSRLATAIGDAGQAKAQCDRALSLLPRDDVRCLAVFGQLMRVLQLPESVGALEQMERYGYDWLTNNDPPPLLAAQIRGWRAAARGARGYRQDDAPLLAEAVVELRGALETLKATAEERLADRFELAIYRRERAFLADALAQLSCFIGEIAAAWRLLEHEREALIGSPDALLLARIKNNLGFIDYYMQDNVHGPADQFFRDALAVRDQRGDRVGAIRSAANLVGLLGEAAESAAQWEEALTIGDKYLKQAQQLQQIQSVFNLRANLSEIRIRRGDLEPARALLATGGPDPLLTLKLAWCALWAGQHADCASLLDTLHAPLVADGEPQDRWEWAQCVCELCLHAELVGAPSPPAALDARAAQVVAEGEPYGTTPRARADSAYTYGLYHLTHGDPDSAVADFEHCQTMWEQVDMHYRAACAGIWLAAALAEIGETVSATRVLQASAARLARFGAIPALQLLGRLRDRIDRQA